MKVKVNDRYNLEIEIINDQLKVNGAEIQIDSRRIANNNTHVIYKNRSYSIELVSENRAEKISIIKVNGTLYHIEIVDKYDELLKQLGMDNTQANKIREIKAPMPGLVLSLIADEGTEVHKGDSLLVLEAMKMENIIKSPTDGIIKKIFVNQGDKVEKNEILIQFN